MIASLLEEVNVMTDKVNEQEQVLFRETEAGSLDAMYRVFDWRKELRKRRSESIAKTVLRQVNINLFQGSGLGGLASTAELILSMATIDQHTGEYRIPAEVGDLLRDSHCESQKVIESLSKAQALLMDDMPFTETAPVSDLLATIRSEHRELEPMLAIKKQNSKLGGMEMLATDRPIRFQKEAIRAMIRELLINGMKYSAEDSCLTTLVFAGRKGIEVKFLNPIPTREIGLNADRCHLLFEPFYRQQAPVDDRYTLEEFGFGLGLTVVRKIIELHGGEIYIYPIHNHLDNREKLNLCVTVMIPYA